MTTAEHLRDAGMAQAESAADPADIEHIDAAIAYANESGAPWSANDIRHMLPGNLGPLVGARVRAAAMRRPREMRPVGYVPSDLPSTHAHPVRQWIGT